MGKYNLDSVRGIYKGRGQIHLELVSDKWRTEKAAFLPLFRTADADQDQRRQGGESSLCHAVVKSKHGA